MCFPIKLTFQLMIASFKMILWFLTRAFFPVSFKSSLTNALVGSLSILTISINITPVRVDCALVYILENKWYCAQKLYSTLTSSIIAPCHYVAIACGGQNTRSDYTWLSGSGKSNLNEPGTPKYCPKIARRLPTDCPQIAPRLPTYCPQTAQRLLTDYPQTFIDFPQIAHRLPADCQQIALGLPTECLRISFGLPTDFIWIAYVVSSDYIRINWLGNAHGLLKDCSRASIHY